MICCVVCSKLEKDQNKIITCMYCFSEAHIKCRNISSNAAVRIKEKMYFCTPQCSSIYQRIFDLQNKKASLITCLSAELKDTVANAVTTEMQSVRSEMKQLTTAIEHSQEFISHKFDSIADEFNALKSENEILKEEIKALKISLSTLTGTVHKLEIDVDRNANITVEDTAVLHGIPFSPDEDVQKIVSQVMDRIGVELHSDSICRVSRIYENKKLPNPLIPIKITFKTSQFKDHVFQMKKRCGKLLSSSIDPLLMKNGQPTTVNLRDELTPISLMLLKQARELQKSLNLKYVWSGRGGTVWMKKYEYSKPLAIRSRHDLENVEKLINSTESE